MIHLRDTEATPPKLIRKHIEVEGLSGKDLDSLYYSERAITGYNRTFNIALGPREIGKTTRFLRKGWEGACSGKGTFIYVARHLNTFSSGFIEMEIRSRLQQFYEVPPFEFSSSELNNGWAIIYAEGYPVMAVVALGMRTDKLKRVFVRNPNFMFMDEMVINTKKGERYLNEEATALEELYNTITRQKRGLKVYLCGNVYSMYNPYFLRWGVDTTKLRKGGIYVNDKCAVELPVLNPRLREIITRKNVNYKFDDFYTKYALDGEALNDRYIKINPRFPRGYKLRFVLVCEGYRIGIYSNGDNFYATYTDGSERKTALSFDIKELIEGSRVITLQDRMRTGFFKMKMGKNEVVFKDLACYYLLEDIWRLL